MPGRPIHQLQREGGCVAGTLPWSAICRADTTLAEAITNALAKFLEAIYINHIVCHLHKLTADFVRDVHKNAV